MFDTLEIVALVAGLVAISCFVWVLTNTFTFARYASAPCRYACVKCNTYPGDEGVFIC